jgi:hypothetical protein
LTDLGRRNCGVFVVFPVELSAHNNQPLFQQKKYDFKSIKGMHIWVWNMNLGWKELGI